MGLVDGTGVMGAECWWLGRCEFEGRVKEAGFEYSLGCGVVKEITWIG